MSHATLGDATDSLRAELGRALAQVAALEQLLEVHEQTALEQTNLLEEALTERTALLERETEARAARDRALTEARIERARLYEVFMQAPAAITVLEGRAHVFTVVNDRYRELVGGREIEGKTIHEALPELQGQGFYELLDHVYETGEPFVANESPVRLDRDGDGIAEEIYVDFVYQPMKASDGSVFGIMAHAVEITERVHARRVIEEKVTELAQLSQKLEQSNKELDQFAYVASHDLKAPLRGIANLTQWIEEDLGDLVTGESLEHMQLLKGRVHRMEALIEGILAYSRAGRTRERTERVDMGEMLAEVIELLAAPEGSVTVEGTMPTLMTERVPLQQVFMNLVSNALKHAERDDPRVVVRSAPDGAYAHFSVSDNGPGIAPQYREKIWQIFQTLAPRDRVEGTGIGLSVVRKLVELREGTAWVESEPGHGSTFHFTWPTGPRTSL